MSKIYLFLPDFRALIKNTLSIPEFAGFNHDVFYYEDDEWIYFYKPIGSFVYCLELLKSDLPKDVNLENLKKNEFKAIEVTKKLYLSEITTTTTGVMKQ